MWVPEVFISVFDLDLCFEGFEGQLYTLFFLFLCVLCVPVVSSYMTQSSSQYYVLYRHCNHRGVRWIHLSQHRWDLVNMGSIKADKFLDYISIDI
jgi:hypothetical protein